MEPVDEAIVRHYTPEHPRGRPYLRGLGQLELMRAREVLRRHPPEPPADVLDVGGATGVHAAWLAGDGYRVRVIDISQRYVERANADLGALGVVAELGDARQLDSLDDA